MLDDLVREIEGLKEIQIPVEPDEDGYLDKECPSEWCMFQFKILQEDWTERVSDEQVFCPLCGHSAPADSWWTTEQVEEATNQAVDHFKGRIGEALRRGAKRFNRKQPRNSFLQISLEVKGTRSCRALVPLRGSEPLDLRIACDECSTRFAVVGSAFFCPACGHSSATRVFDDSIKKARLKAEACDTIRSQYADLGQRDEGEILARSLLETALTDCVVAFQRLCEELYSIHPQGGPVKGNAFQRLGDGSQLWRGALGSGYEDWLSDEELSMLSILFQRRHLLQHTEGVVDQRYVDRSGDTTYDVGQRLVIRKEDVLRISDLVETLAQEIRSKVRGPSRGT